MATDLVGDTELAGKLGLSSMTLMLDDDWTTAGRGDAAPRLSLALGGGVGSVTYGLSHCTASVAVL